MTDSDRSLCYATPDLVSTSVSCGVQFVFTLLFICYIPITLYIHYAVYLLSYVFIMLCIHYIIYIVLYTPIRSAAASCVRLLFFNLFQKKKAKIFSGNFLGMWLCLSGKQPFFIWKRPLLIHYNAPPSAPYMPLNCIDNLYR